MKNTFQYKGLTVIAVGNIKGGAAKASYSGDAFAPEGYSHADFYEVARQNNLSCDVYKIETKELYRAHYVVPCNSGFLRLVSFWKNIKLISQYKRWYKTAREKEED